MQQQKQNKTKPNDIIKYTYTGNNLMLTQPTTQKKSNKKKKISILFKHLID